MPGDGENVTLCQGLKTASLNYKGTQVLLRCLIKAVYTHIPVIATIYVQYRRKYGTVLSIAA